MLFHLSRTQRKWKPDAILHRSIVLFRAEQSRTQESILLNANPFGRLQTDFPMAQIPQVQTVESLQLKPQDTTSTSKYVTSEKVYFTNLFPLHLLPMVYTQPREYN